MSFWLVPNSVTLDDLEWCNSPDCSIILQISVAFRADYVKVVEDTPICRPKNLIFSDISFMAILAGHYNTNLLSQWCTTGLKNKERQNKKIYTNSGFFSKISLAAFILASLLRSRHAMCIATNTQLFNLLVVLFYTLLALQPNGTPLQWSNNAKLDQINWVDMKANYMKFSTHN